MSTKTFYEVYANDSLQNKEITLRNTLEKCVQV